MSVQKLCMNPASTEFESRLHRLRWWHWTLLAAIVLLALAPCDIPVARLCYQYPAPRLGFRLCEIVGDMAGGGGEALLLLTVAVIFSRTRISRVPQLVAITLGGGLLADVVKISIFRGRPYKNDLSVATFESTFHGLFPLFSAGSNGQSFPSGHAATAIGLAAALSILFPRGRWFFASLALTVAACRVIVHAHFPTDVAAALMLGGASAYACQRGFAVPAFAWCECKIDRAIARRRANREAKVDNSKSDTGKRNAA